MGKIKRLASGPKMTPTREQRIKFRELREKRGLTQAELGAKIGVSGPTISNIENLENTRHQQVYAAVYAELVRVLKTGDGADDVHGERLARVVDKFLRLSDAYGEAVEAMIDSLLAEKK